MKSEWRSGRSWTASAASSPVPSPEGGRGAHDDLAVVELVAEVAQESPCRVLSCRRNARTRFFWYSPISPGMK